MKCLMTTFATPFLTDKTDVRSNDANAQKDIASFEKKPFASGKQFCYKTKTKNRN